MIREIKRGFVKWKKAGRNKGMGYFLVPRFIYLPERYCGKRIRVHYEVED